MSSRTSKAAKLFVLCAALQFSATFADAGKANRLVETKDGYRASNGEIYNIVSIVRLRDKRAIVAVANTNAFDKPKVLPQKQISQKLAVPMLKRACMKETGKKISVSNVRSHLETPKDFETGRTRYVWQFEINCS